MSDNAIVVLIIPLLFCGGCLLVGWVAQYIGSARVRQLRRNRLPIARSLR